MKKLKVLLVVLLMAVCVDVFASAPAVVKHVVVNDIQQGDTFTVSTYLVRGNSINYPTPEGVNSFDFLFDKDTLEFVSFKSECGFRYDLEKMLLIRDDGLVLPFYGVSDSDPIEIWSFTFKVKDNAKIGETVIGGQTYSIIEKEENKSDDVVIEEDNVVEDDKNNSSDNINIFLITTIVFGVVSLIEFVYIVVKKNKKA